MPKPRLVVHYAANETSKPACGLWRYTVIAKISNRRAVTCKNCKRAMDRYDAGFQMVKRIKRALTRTR